MTDSPRVSLEGVTAIPRIDARALTSARATCVIDLRSPGEFAEDHVPGAVNVPLFDDVQRALVGTLYRQVSPSAAFCRLSMPAGLTIPGILLSGFSAAKSACVTTCSGR